ncbi:hypothetical protein [Geoalkalibacter halelectricus]|uniref:SpoVT-AbrB domain-containing protein n=1 Tax=Geoalkalibacter halelectricus TaxID=2847045 RepID=A0ABY5ZR78_9BACT|nr:hypothetical protein [Geoalkalibacter halelectricus]MDO3377113.1 hypothetical protein [Geoalkalibacter halelectricus]UWZ79731.1 hypothetical protein L9S41_18930 [Geoalkalibacter halelectricus]
MDSFQGEFHAEFVNGGICLPMKFARVFRQYPSDKLALFKIEEDNQCPKIKGQLGLAELGTDNELGPYMQFSEKPFVIEKPLSSPWRIMLPPEFVEAMGLRDGDTLVLAGMFEHVVIATQEIYQRVTAHSQELLLQCLKNDTDKEEQ